MTRCRIHGGANPEPKIKAELMLAQLRIPAIEALFNLLDQLSGQTCPTCGFPKADIEEKKLLVQLATKTLDRTGLGPTSKVELTTQTDGALNLGLLTVEERAALTGLIAQVKEIKERVRARQQGLPVPPLASTAPESVH